MPEDEHKEEDITFDFSKIRKIFKKKKKAEKQVEVETQAQTEEKEKVVIEHTQKPVTEKKSSDDEVSVDFSKIKNIFTNKKIRTYWFLLLLIIPLFLAVDIRMTSSDLPITEDWARESILNNMRNQISDQVRAESSNLPPESLEREVNRRLQQELEQNKQQFENTVVQTSEYFKSRMQDDSGQTYLLAIDPWHYYRQVRNLIENGHIGDRLVDDRPYDDYVGAPRGEFVDQNLHPYLGHLGYKILKPITGKSLMSIFFLLPVILSALSIIPAFFIGRKVGGNLGGFIAATLLGVHSMFVSRTAGGFSDTDAYSITLPLFAIWFFLEAFETDNKKYKVIFSALSGFCLGLFAFAWPGWWYIFVIILAAMIIYLAFYFFTHLSKLKIKNIFKHKIFVNTILLIVLFIIFSALFVSLFTSFAAYKGAILHGPLEFSQIKDVATVQVWPNVYTTVAELNEASFGDIIGQIGGKTIPSLFFLIGLLGIILTMTRKDKFGIYEMCLVGFSFIWYLILLLIIPNSIWFFIMLGAPIAVGILVLLIKNYENVDLKYALLLILWFVAAIYASRKGIRFVMILVPAFSIAFGVACGIIYKRVSESLSKGLQMNKLIVQVILIACFILLILSPIKQGYDQGKGEIPSMNDAWWESLTYIKDNSQPDAIINSWWDFGHWFKAIADRPVTFDGSSQNRPQAHWIGKTLLTSDEETAIGILRMLDCGAEYAFNDVMAVIDHHPKSVDLLNKIIVQDKEDAKITLAEYGFNEEQIKNVTQKTHCEPPEDFFIASEDMIGKAGVWGHFGSWDFNRALMYQQAKGKTREEGVQVIMEDFNKSKEEANELYYQIQNQDANQWISPWPGYMLPEWRSCKPAINNTLKCDYNIAVSRGSGQIAILEYGLIDLKNLNNSRMHLVVRQENSNKKLGESDQIPSSIALVTEEGIDKFELPNATFGGALLVSTDSSGKNFRSLIADQMNVDSMFTTMFFLNGHGLKYFDLVKHTTSVTGLDIFVYKVDWEGLSRNNMFKQDKVHAKHILVCSEGDTNCKSNRTVEEASRLVNSTWKKATTKNFETLAKQYSDDPGSGPNGGDLGWFGKGDMIKEFEETAYSLEVGEISKPIKSQFGYHIIYLLEKG